MNIWELIFNRIRVFENRILRRIFGPNRDDNGEWRRIHNEELHCLYRSPYVVRVIKSRRLRWAGHVARIEEGRSAFKILTGKQTGKRALGRRRWEDNIRRNWNWGIGLILLRVGIIREPFECSIEPLGSISHCVS